MFDCYCKNIKTNKIFQVKEQLSLISSDLLFVPVSQLPKNCKIIYCGRPSVFGNPFSHLDKTLAKFKVNSREEAISKYEKYLESNDQLKEAIFEQIQKPLNQGFTICLECFCLPQKCHCEAICKHSLLKS